MDASSVYVTNELDPLTQIEFLVSESLEQTDMFCYMMECNREDLERLVSYLKKIGHL